MYTKILVPIDGSVHSQHALSVACKLSEQNSTKVYVLHIPEVVGNTTKLSLKKPKRLLKRKASAISRQ